MINGINTAQELLWNTLSDTSGSNRNGLFNGMLSDAILEMQKNEEESAGMYAQLLKEDSAYALLACLLSQGAPDIMLMSMGNALRSNTEPEWIQSYMKSVAHEYTGSTIQDAWEIQGDIPASPGKPVQPAITSEIGNRSARLYSAVIEQFSVETHQRYSVN